MDPLGNPTFGIGHLITSSDPEYGEPAGTPVSDARVDEAFQHDIRIAISSSESWCNGYFRNWPSEVKQIIVNMMFNLGISRMNGFVKFCKALKVRNWNRAADEMESSAWYRQVGARAKRLVQRMRNVRTLQGGSGSSGAERMLRRW
nr:phage lysozyme 2 [Solen strictus]